MSKRKNPRANWSRLLVLSALVVTTVALFAVAVWTTSTRDMTALENTTLQFLAVFFGALYSWLLGDSAGRRNAQAEMRARAQPAFRRVVRLYEAQGRVLEQADLLIDDLSRRSRNGQVDLLAVRSAFNTIQVQVGEQIGTSNDAMEDWRDLAPNDVAELEQRARLREQQYAKDEISDH